MKLLQCMHSLFTNTKGSSVCIKSRKVSYFYGMETLTHTPISLFDYDLPDERIAKFPVSPRHSSKLLVYDGAIQVSEYINLGDFLPDDALLIVNNTKVVEARLHFQKSTGGQIEIFCLEHAEVGLDVSSAMTKKSTVLWNCQVGGAKKWKEGLVFASFTVEGKEVEFTAEKISTAQGIFTIRFTWNHPDLSFAEVLHYSGNIPLPPYLNRNTTDEDKNTYQTVYAQLDGSVAAPTAGLHFTPELFNKLSTKNIKSLELTLHVGAGTFKPVKDEVVENHHMHAEFIEVERAFIEDFCKGLNRTRIAVGTTSLRTLESLYWMGVKTLQNPNISTADLEISQWEAYELKQDISTEEAFKALLDWMNAKQVDKLFSKTGIMVKPGYTIRTVDAILTNFHQPKSTLLLLIHAFVGDNWKEIYDYALHHDFRFLSYGDGSLLWKRKL